MNKNLNTIFSENLRRLLDERDKTQADLYRYMGVSSAIVSAWCSGKKIPRADKLQKMCVWFNCELSDLLEEKQNDDSKVGNDTEEKRKVNKLVKSIEENPENLKIHMSIIDLDEEKKKTLSRLLKYMNEGGE